MAGDRIGIETTNAVRYGAVNKIYKIFQDYHVNHV